MSADDPGQREVARRLFAAEYDDADYSYSESDEERAPNYVVTPTGARVNRLFVAGVLTTVERVNDDMLRGRVADPTGAFVLYAGQYQPDERAFLDRADPPAFVAVTGKARTFEPEDGDRVYTSVRPESLSTVDTETRDRWILQAATQTLGRVRAAATALSTGLSGDGLREALDERGFDPATADGVTRALAHYNTTAAYLDGVRRLAVDAVRVVAGDRDEVRPLDVAPDDPGDVTVDDLLASLPAEGDGPRGLGDGTESADETGVAGTDRHPEGESVEVTDAETTDETAEDIAEAGGSTTDTGDETVVDASAETTDESDETVVDASAETTAGDDTVVDASAETTGDEEEVTADAGEFEPGEFDLSDDVREEVEAEYGTDFQSGTEVDEPGEADIPTLDEPVEEVAEPAPDLSEGAGHDTGAAEQDATAGDGTDAGEETDPQEAVLAVLSELDDGDGVDQERLESVVVERHGLTPAEVEEGIESALMDGKCYEPDERSLKPI